MSPSCVIWSKRLHPLVPRFLMCQVGMVHLISEGRWRGMCTETQRRMACGCPPARRGRAAGYNALAGVCLQRNGDRAQASDKGHAASHGSVSGEGPAGAAEPCALLHRLLTRPPPPVGATGVFPHPAQDPDIFLRTYTSQSFQGFAWCASPWPHLPLTVSYGAGCLGLRWGGAVL